MIKISISEREKLRHLTRQDANTLVTGNDFWEKFVAAEAEQCEIAMEYNSFLQVSPQSLGYVLA